MEKQTNSKKFLAENFAELIKYKQTTSRMYEKGDKPGYQDSWWFKFVESDLDENEFIIFVGARDYENKDFKILKVPTQFLKANKGKIDINERGWTNLYIHF